MMSLQIQQTRGQIGIQTSPGQVQIESPKQTLEMSVSQAHVKVEATLPKITIDQSQCFSESGLKGIVDFMSEAVSFAKSQMLQSMGRIAEQGNQLTDIHLSTTAIQDQGVYNAYDQFIYDYNMETMPKSRPTINVREGTLDISVQEGEIRNNTKVQRANISYRPGSVQISMLQYPSINIQAIDTKV